MSQCKYFLLLVIQLTLHFSIVQGASEIIDLSQDFRVGNLTNPGALLIEQKIISKVPETRRLLVLEHGKVVANYVRKQNGNPNAPVDPNEPVDPNQPFGFFSAQKSLDNLLFGLAIESSNLTLKDTLYEVFPDESIWSGVPEADYKKNVTIYELLTMTSGLGIDFTPASCCYDPINLFSPDNCQECSDMAGSNLKEALSFVKVVAPKGKWFYLIANGFLEYIIKAKTGLNPRELMNTKVFPLLGIDDNSIGWRKTSDGIDTLTAGLYLTAYQMAKFGQLFLQRGMSAPSKPIISSNWIMKSTSKLVEVVNNSTNDGPKWYGFWWYTYNGCTVGNDQVGEYHCAFGFLGQVICFYPELQRGFVCQSDCIQTGCINDYRYYDVLLFDSSTSFDPEGKINKASKNAKLRKPQCNLESVIKIQ